FWEHRSVASSHDGKITAYGFTQFGRVTVHTISGFREEDFPPTLVVMSGNEALTVDPKILSITDKNDISAMQFSPDKSTLAIVGTRKRFWDSGFVLLVDVTKPKAALRTDPVYLTEPVNCVG